MRFGVMEMVSLAATLTSTIPVGGFDSTLLANGRIAFDGTMLLLTALMVTLPKFLTMPQDLLLLMVERVVGGVIEESDNKG